jgi:outer membrane protein TolC
MADAFRRLTSLPRFSSRLRNCAPRAASRAGLHLAERRYAEGRSDAAELEDAERDYTSDAAAYASALYGFSVAKAAWIKRLLAHC